LAHVIWTLVDGEESQLEFDDVRDDVEQSNNLQCSEENAMVRRRDGRCVGWSDGHTQQEWEDRSNQCLTVSSDALECGAGVKRGCGEAAMMMA